MEIEIKEALEKSVSNDLDYIISYKPRAIGAKSAQHFSKMNIIKPIALNAYPQIYIDLVKRFDRDEAIRRLKSLGLRETKFLYATFPDLLKKPQNFNKIFTEAAKKHLHSKLIFKNKVLENKILRSMTLVVKDCFFCSEIEPFEDIDIPYCTPNAGLYENLYNLKSLYNQNMNPRLVQIEALKSARYDGDTCVYLLSVID
ncbi:MAG: hypothetical protein HWN66_00660 [Candidatus Helarchaeota archaeon]|nr:hypothetical protein [Candidatus Helarchaeota archaeon]